MVGGRRLSELLREQQEPFLLLLPGGGGGSEAAPCCSVEDKGARASWGRAVRRALPRWGWDDLAAGCFPCAALRKRESFRPLPRAGHARCDDGDGDARWLSPVSVLDVLRCSDDEEEAWSSPTLSDSGEEEDDDKPSSPPPDPLTGEKEGKSEEEWRKVVSSWERIAWDISRVPALAQLDLLSSMSAREWEWHGEAEAERVGARLEAIILEEMSAEAVVSDANMYDPRRKEKKNPRRYFTFSTAGEFRHVAGAGDAFTKQCSIYHPFTGYRPVHRLSAVIRAVLGLLLSFLGNCEYIFKSK